MKIFAGGFKFREGNMGLENGKKKKSFHNVEKNNQPYNSVRSIGGNASSSCAAGICQ